MCRLNKEQRIVIETLKKRGCTFREIAAEINVHPTTVAREIRRNSVDGVYRCCDAEKLAKQRIKNKPKRKMFSDDMRAFVEAHLHLKMSPEQISGLARQRLGFAEFVSAQSIYNHIRNDRENGGLMYKLLPRAKKSYRKHTPKKTLAENSGKVNISERPPAASDRSRFGDLEIDTVVSKDRKTGLVTVNDRASGFLFAGHCTIAGESVTEKLIEILLPLKNLLRTIASDNGKEFNEHVKIREKLDVDYYHCDAHAPWQRGSNENLNGLLRRFFPKKYDFNKVSEKELKDVLSIINSRPRKRYGYYSPIEIILGLTNN